MSEINISRRSLIKGAAAGMALTAAAIGGMSGCSSGDDEPVDGEVLPLGTVVQLKGCEDTKVMHMIMARRPLATKQRYYDESGNIQETDDERVYDYAGVYWPYGVGTDFSEKPFDGEVWIFDAEAIAKVVYRGYEDDLEKKAASLIQDAGDGQSCADILADMMVSDVYMSDPDYAAEHGGN